MFLTGGLSTTFRRSCSTISIIQQRKPVSPHLQRYTCSVNFKSPTRTFSQLLIYLTYALQCRSFTVNLLVIFVLLRTLKFYDFFNFFFYISCYQKICSNSYASVLSISYIKLALYPYYCQHSVFFACYQNICSFRMLYLCLSNGGNLQEIRLYPYYCQRWSCALLNMGTVVTVHPSRLIIFVQYVVCNSINRIIVFILSIS